MPRKKPDVPPFRIHKATGQAYTLIDGARRYLGRADKRDAKSNYDRLVAEWLSSGRQTIDRPDDLTVAELGQRFLRHAEVYYRQPDGSVSTEVDAFKMALRPLTALYGDTPAKVFGPLAFKAVRQSILDNGCGKPDTPRRADRTGCNRHNTNKLANRVRHLFKWAVAEELLHPSVYQALAAVPGLKRGRCEAREGQPVKPVPQEHIEAIQDHVSKQVWALVQLQLLTGARAGELVTMRSVDIDTTGKIWTYEP